MKVFLKRLLLFTITLLIVACIIDICYTKMLVKIPGESEVWEDIYNEKVKDNCLIYGSSRAKVHFDPLIIEDITGVTAYNFGMDGQAFDIQYLRHKINIKANGYPLYIIHSLDAFTFGRNDELQNKQQFTPYIFWNKDLITSLDEYKSFNYAEYFVPLFRYYGNVDNVKRTLINEIKPRERDRMKGYKIEDKEWSDDFERMEAGMGLYKVQIDSDLKEQYINFIKECKDNDVKLALVYTPEHISGQQHLQGRDSIIHFYEKLSEEYDLPYLDYTKDSICSDTTYFYNTMHLNRKGSIIITEKITHDLQKIGFF